jgi:hypothetical protein
MSDRAALVEKVARAMAEEKLWPGVWERMPDQERETFRPMAFAAIDLIRAETLEEAAKAAEGIKTVWIDGYAFHVDGPSKDTIAAAIRALKEAPCSSS